MELFFSAKEIWQLAVIKLLFYAFIALGICFYFRFKKPILFVGLISLFSAGSYFFLSLHSQLPWWGLQGDEIFVFAFLEKAASGRFFSDFFYPGLPPFYPPLYFWAAGGLGYLFKLNGVQAGRLGVFLVLFLLPLAVYFWQWLFWRKREEDKLLGWQLVLAPALVMVVAEPAAIIFKPYEFVSAVLIVLWSVFLLDDLFYQTLGRLKIMIYGLTGGLLFLTFYFWFFPIFLALALFKLFCPAKIPYYFGRLAAIALLVIAISLPYTWPLFNSYLAFGSDNWQPAFFIPEDLNLYLPFFNFSIFGLAALAGLSAIIFYWKKARFKALGLLLLSAYVWQLINLLAIIVFQAPFLPQKPFLFFGGAAISMALAFGLAEFINDKIKNQNIMSGLFILGWIILASQLLGGSFMDDPGARKQFLAVKQPLREEYLDLIEGLESIDNLSELTVLSSGLGEVSAFLPLNYYISYNIHFSHPAAGFFDRFYFISNLTAASSAKDFYQKLKMAPLGPIDALLLLKGDGFYPINFWLDKYPLGAGGEELRLSADLINERYFAKIFEDKHFVFYKVK